MGVGYIGSKVLAFEVYRRMVETLAQINHFHKSIKRIG